MKVLQNICYRNKTVVFDSFWRKLNIKILNPDIFYNIRSVTEFNQVIKFIQCLFSNLLFHKNLTDFYKLILYVLTVKLGKLIECYFLFCYPAVLFFPLCTDAEGARPGAHLLPRPAPGRPSPSLLVPPGVPSQAPRL